MGYKYQMHTHTAPTSKCARTTPEELALALHEAGYAGCVLTNHFYHGNTGVSRELSWGEFVAAYERDYLECKAAGEKYGLDILFGVEEGVEGWSEILCYGLTPEMLYAHPELRDGGAELWYRVMHSLGVVVVQSHPFRVLRPVPDPKPIPSEYFDGIEVYNRGNRPEYNENAERYAAENEGMILTSGADTHDPHDVGFAGIEVDERITTPDQLASILREGKYGLIKN